MKCFYINLDGATARRENLERSFHSHAAPDWELVRVPASGPGDVIDTPGPLTPAEKACWRSHRAAVFASLACDEDCLIVEDDLQFGPRTFQMLERVRAAEATWDLCFTEIGLRVENMMLYAQRYAQYAAAGAVSLNDLSRLKFSTASGYLVRHASKVKLIRLLDAVASLDRAYDFFLQDLTHSGQLRSIFCFPFITQPGPHAEASQIQPSVHELRDRMHVSFRRLMHLDRDLDALEPELAQLEALHGDRGAALVGKVFGALASDAMRLSAPAPTSGGGRPSVASGGSDR